MNSRDGFDDGKRAGANNVGNDRGLMMSVLVQICIIAEHRNLVIELVMKRGISLNKQITIFFSYSICLYGLSAQLYI